MAASFFRYLLCGFLLPIWIVFAESSSHTENALERRDTPASNYWFQNIKRQGIVAYGDPTYKIYRNVMDYGAMGDGVTDDTIAINAAISDGNRCGNGSCDSTTLTPAVIYFPAGKYYVSTPLQMQYMTQCVGDATNLPTIIGAPNFFGLGIFDADPYLLGGQNWFTNQNNFYRQIRNFIIDMTQMSPGFAHGIHWQVAQATSLQNIVFNMIEGGENNNQQGIFMDNGSANFMGDLIFNGGGICMFVGNQQYGVRNITFNNCQTAIFQNWGWMWVYKDLYFNGCGIGLDMSNGGSVQTAGSIVIQDSTFNNTPYAIVTTFTNTSQPISGGTLTIDNVDFTGSIAALSYPNGTVILEGGTVIDSFLQGNAYTAYFNTEIINNKTCLEPGASPARVQNEVAPPPKEPFLLDENGRFYSRYKPQYEGEPLSAFVSVKSTGAKGDGLTDDTAAIQAIFDAATFDQIIYFDHGVYLITDTIQVPTNIRMTGELWPIIMVEGSAFPDQTNPKAAWRVGNPGDTGRVEMSEMVFEVRGPAPGAIIVEWNLAGDAPTLAGMWDVHWRIGGSAGTLLQSDNCTKTPDVLTPANSTCIAAYMLMHITKTGSVYMENNWGWVADHEIDLADHNQINIYNGRGILIESQVGVWLIGTSFEHSMLYNYAIANANAVYMAGIQHETAYMQDNPNALVPFPPNASYSDPTFNDCYAATCYKTWGLYITNSNNVLSYGAGLYSFFNNYDQGCLLTESCQQNIVGVMNSSAIYLYNLNTKASSAMVTIDGVGVVSGQPNLDTFCQTIVLFEEP